MTIIDRLEIMYYRVSYINYCLSCRLKTCFFVFKGSTSPTADTTYKQTPSTGVATATSTVDVTAAGEHRKSDKHPEEIHSKSKRQGVCLESSS